MFNKKKKTGSSAKKCPQCFAHIRSDARKCKYCSYKFSSSGGSLVGKIKQALRIDRVFRVVTADNQTEAEHFFTVKEIETLIKLDNINILMFLTLDNITMLDETALLELGKTLSRVDDNNVVIK